jgi:hypothetical protein
MRRESEVDFEEVRETFLRDNAATPERNAWPLGALEVANKQFGKWTRVVLIPEEVRAVMLPYHIHKGVQLVPPTGSSVSEAIEKLDSVDRLSECYKRIQQFTDPLTTAVFLSAAPIDDSRYSDYKGLLVRNYKGRTHLDGLHRLIAWGRENRPEIPAYVAGLEREAFDRIT